MSDLYITPNMEALVAAFLRDQAELAGLDDRIVTALGKDQEYPALRVTQLLDTPRGSPLWDVAFEIQVESFGGSKSEAWRYAVTARAAIDQRLVGVYPGHGVVNGTKPGALLDLPDETFKPAKPRWIFTSTIYGRPGATVPS